MSSRPWQTNMASKYLHMDAMMLNVIVAVAVVIISYFILVSLSNYLSRSFYL